DSAAARTSDEHWGNTPSALSAPNADTVAGPKAERPDAPSRPAWHQGIPEAAANRASAASFPIPTTRAPRAWDSRAAATASGVAPHATTTTRQSGPTNLSTTASWQTTKGTAS